MTKTIKTVKTVKTVSQMANLKETTEVGGLFSFANVMRTAKANKAAAEAAAPAPTPAQPAPALTPAPAPAPTPAPAELDMDALLSSDNREEIINAIEALKKTIPFLKGGKKRRYNMYLEQLERKKKAGKEGKTVTVTNCDEGLSDEEILSSLEEMDRMEEEEAVSQYNNDLSPILDYELSPEPDEEEVIVVYDDSNNLTTEGRNFLEKEVKEGLEKGGIKTAFDRIFPFKKWEVQVLWSNIKLAYTSGDVSTAYISKVSLSGAEYQKARLLVNVVKEATK